MHACIRTLVGGGRESRPVVVHVKKPDNMVFAGFSAFSWFFRGLRMHVHRTVAAGRGGGGRDSFILFSRRLSRSPPCSTLLKYLKILNSYEILLKYIKLLRKYTKLY